MYNQRGTDQFKVVRSRSKAFFYHIVVGSCSMFILYTVIKLMWALS